LIPIPRPEYPRPQFRRKDWTNLNGEWSFAFDDSDARLTNCWQSDTPEDSRSDNSPFDRRITVPFCYQSKHYGIGEPAFRDASVEVGVSVEGIEPGMSLRATVDLAGEQVLEDTLTLRSSLVACPYGFSEEDFAFFREHPTEPDILGVNYYPHMTTTQILPDGGRRTVWSGTEGIEELIRAFYVRYDKPIFWTETSVSGPVEDRLLWLEDSLGLVHRLRSEGLPLVGYTWWPLFSLLDWAYREGE